MGAGVADYEEDKSIFVCQRINKALFVTEKMEIREKAGCCR